MFKKILITNRGEIACRVIRIARKMGVSGGSNVAACPANVLRLLGHNTAPLEYAA